MVRRSRPDRPVAKGFPGESRIRKISVPVVCTLHAEYISVCIYVWMYGCGWWFIRGWTVGVGLPGGRPIWIGRDMIYPPVGVLKGVNWDPSDWTPAPKGLAGKPHM